MQVRALQNSIDRIRRCIAVLRDQERKPSLNDETYFTDKELQALLRVSRRCLQEWRNKGILPYHVIGGKVLYSQSDIQKLLNEHRFNVK